MRQTDKRFDKSNYLHLSELGSAFNLSFSSHEILSKEIIGLDGIKRKVLVIEKDNGLSNHYIIELDTVSVISVKKIYKGIKPGELKNKRIEAFLESICLQFEFRDGKDHIGLLFYENGINEIQDLPGLERKARSWQVILSKMINTRNTEISIEKNQGQFAG